MKKIKNVLQYVGYADMAELADALDLGSSGRPWGFKSLYPHQVGPSRTFRFGWADFLLPKKLLRDLNKEKICLQISRTGKQSSGLFIGYGRTGESPFIRTKRV